MSLKPLSDRFYVKGFHHVELYCGDATNVSRRFSWGLGMPIVAKSDLSTGNTAHCSYCLRSRDLNCLFTSSYSPAVASPTSAAIPTFDSSLYTHFITSHGLGVRALAVEVDDVDAAFSISVAHGARPASKPVRLHDVAQNLDLVMAEVQLYGDVVLRYISYNSKGNNNDILFPGFEPMQEQFSFSGLDLKLTRLDHAVGNVPELVPVLEYIQKFTGFHRFSEFTKDDLGETETGFNLVSVANNNEMVLLQIAEPVHGMKRKSHLQTFLEHNEGAGVQHIAFMSEDILWTCKEMRKRSGIGGFEFMPSPPPTYYANLKNRVGDVLSDDQIKECEDLGIMVDKDDQGTLLQIFTKTVGDRPTLYLEIIQRIGCMMKDSEGKMYQKGGCGGFGKGNIKELYISREKYAKTMDRQPLHEYTPTLGIVWQSTAGR